MNDQSVLVPLIDGWVCNCKYPDYLYPYHVREPEGLIVVATVQQRADWRAYIDRAHLIIDVLATPRTRATRDLRVKTYTLYPGAGYHQDDFMVMARACLTDYVPTVEVFGVS